MPLRRRPSTASPAARSIWPTMGYHALSVCCGEQKRYPSRPNMGVRRSHSRHVGSFVLEGFAISSCRTYATRARPPFKGGCSDARRHMISPFIVSIYRCLGSLSATRREPRQPLP
jgi:hypothetical protein